MASARVIPCMSYKRLAAVSSLRNVCIFSRFDAVPGLRQSRTYSAKKSIAKADPIDEASGLQVRVGEVVKENVKSFGYLSVIIGGVGITCVTLYMVFSELFSSKSPYSVYSKALDACKKNSKVVDALGEPIKGYGEESRRGRRGHINYITFEENGARHLRMKFYIQGIRKRGTVNLEVQENTSGKYEYRYLYVVVDDFLQTVIKLEDNRDPRNRLVDEPEFNLS